MKYIFSLKELNGKVYDKEKSIWKTVMEERINDKRVNNRKWFMKCFIFYLYVENKWDEMNKYLHRDVTIEVKVYYIGIWHSITF